MNNYLMKESHQKEDIVIKIIIFIFLAASNQDVNSHYGILSNIHNFCYS